jgi:hypothetical protein
MVLSGIDEQKEVELKIRMFFNYDELLEVLQKGDMKKGDVLYLDEDCAFPYSLAGRTLEQRQNWENLKKALRYKGIFFIERLGVLKEVIKLIKRIGLNDFVKMWLGK